MCSAEQETWLSSFVVSISLLKDFVEQITSSYVDNP
jgi:hypothetical protein